MDIFFGVVQWESREALNFCIGVEIIFLVVEGGDWEETCETRREYIPVGSTPTSCRRRSHKSPPNPRCAKFWLLLFFHLKAKAEKITEGKN
jgi:hypothetical protein